MKILLINNYHSLMGGAHRIYLETGKLLKSYGHEVFYFSQKSENNLPYELSDYWSEGIDYKKESFLNNILKAKNFIYNEEAYQKLSKFIDLVKPDIAHIHLFMGGLSTSILLALKEKKVPVVHTPHDYRLICPAYTLFDRNNNICEQCIDKKYFRCATKRCALDLKTSSSIILAIDAYYRNFFLNPLEYIDKFIFVSNFSKNKHIEFNPKFVNNSEVLYNFANINYKENENENSKEYFLYFGRISREKGLENIIDVFNELGYQLFVVGDGFLMNYLKEKSKTNIEFLGYKAGDELYSIISKAKFTVLPTIMYENNPLSVIESFFFGIPIIGSNIGGIPELIGSNGGFTFPPNNLLEIKEVVKKAAGLSNNDYLLMQEHVKKFFDDNLSKEQYYIKLLDIYKNTIARNNEKGY